MRTATQPNITLATHEADITLVDTHAHLHFPNFAGKVDEVLQRAMQAGVTRVITVGTNTDDSRKAVDMAARYESMWATVGIHPHAAGEAEQGMSYIKDLARHSKVVAIGECGLDYYKAETSKVDQERALRLQIEAALVLEMPLVFHVRDAFPDFFQILKDYRGVRGVVHSFTAGPAEIEQVLNHDLIIALNGIVTFVKDAALDEAVRSVPANAYILETDCPFLSPMPHRGKQNEPARVMDIAEYVARLRQAEIQTIATQTSDTSGRLFGIGT